MCASINLKLAVSLGLANGRKKIKHKARIYKKEKTGTLGKCRAFFKKVGSSVIQVELFTLVMDHQRAGRSPSAHSLGT